MPEVWSYQPQGVLSEQLRTGARMTPVGGSFVTGDQTSATIRSWRLQYPVVQASQARSMVAFYEARGGPFSTFEWPNPNDQRTYIARFDSDMAVDLFQPGYVRFGDLLLTTTDSGRYIFTPQSGDANGLGFTVISQWFLTSVIRGTATAQKNFVSESPWAWAMPFTVPRSGTSVDKMGVVVTNVVAVNSAFGFLSIYTAGSGGADMFPSSRLVTPGSVWLTSTGLKVYSFSPIQFASRTLYYGAIATRLFASSNDRVRGAGDSTDAAQIFPLGWTTSFQTMLAWVTASIGTLPATFPTSATQYGDVGGVPLIYFQVCS
jgi:hypothetical protein